MNVFKKLVNYEKEFIPTGSYIKFKGKYPYNEKECLLVFNPNEADYGLGLILATGYKSGFIKVILPAESNFEDSGAIRKDWLIDNWGKWVYPDCDIEEVYICEEVTLL